MRALSIAVAVAWVVACSGASHAPGQSGSEPTGSAPPTDPGPPPPPGSTWRADLQCRDDHCNERGSDCAPTAPNDVLVTEQCGGTEQPPPTAEAKQRYASQRKARIAAQRWPCECHCRAADEASQRDCEMRP